jgi:hypothetical protein
MNNNGMVVGWMGAFDYWKTYSIPYFIVLRYAVRRSFRQSGLKQIDSSDVTAI